jgi:Asp-tRNA(Asn)/Glu-tRNA(Gln) amidotransferase A subunit family amidase
MSETWALGLSEGLRKIAEGGLTAAGWLRALLDRIESCEPALGAWSHLDRAGALAAAEAIDARLGAGQPIGPLAGAPLGVKDLIDVAGLPCEAGSPLFAGRVAERDATAVARLRAAGALVLGKTVTCELGTNQPSATLNPWNRAHSPGASSSGSAVAVATAMVPAALGTQTGGSTIRPAAYCGIVGFKPSFGRISRDGVVALAWSVDHMGVFVRSVADCWPLVAAMAGPDRRDEGTLEVSAGDLATAGHARRPRRVGFLRADFLPRADREVAERILGAAAALRETGVTVDEARLPMDLEQLHSAHRLVVRAESAAHYQDLFRDRPEAFGPDIRNNVVSGLMVPAAAYLKALRLKARFTRAMDRLAADYDLLVSPATLDTAPPVEVSTGDPLFNEPFSASGHPALTLPLGRGDNKLPIGIQLAGARLGEARLLAAAAWCEAELGWRVEIAHEETTT